MEVGELLELDTGTTSKLQGDCPLKGILTIISNEHDPHLYDRGTIILQDHQDVHYSIECVVDRYLPHLTDELVHIKQWSYIYDKDRDSRYVEFVMDSVIVTISQQQSVLRDKITEDNTTMQRILARQQQVIYTPSDYIPPPPPEDKDICLAGRVKAVSALHTLKRSETKFFVQLTSDMEEEKEHTIVVMFIGNDTIKYHRFFNIGLFYAFRHVVPSKLIPEQQQQNQRLVYIFDESKRSACHIISSTLYKNLIPPLLASSTADSTQYPSSASTSTASSLAPPKKRFTITGTITRLVDEVFRIYELDHQYLLCLFHYMGHPPYNQPYRYGTKIKISHFHSAHISTTVQNERGSILLDQFWKNKNHPMIVGCAKTCIEIISLPTHHYDTPPYVEKDFHLKERIEKDMLRRHATFSQLMRQLEIYAVLKNDFPSLTDEAVWEVFQTLRHYIFEKTKTRKFRGSGDYINDFFYHDKACSAIGSDINQKDVFSVELEVCMNLDKVKSELMEGLQPYKLDLAGSNRAFDQGNVEVKMALLDTLSTDYYVMGRVESKDDGRLYLVGSESSQGTKILLQTNRQDLQLGSIYIIRRGQLFQEDLSFKQEDQEGGRGETRHTLDITYLSCDAQDLIPTRHSSDVGVEFYMDYPCEKLNESLAFTFDYRGYNLLEGCEDHVVGYVLDVGPTYLKPYLNENKELTMSLECRAMVLTYELKHKEEEDFYEPMKFQVIMDSKRRGLKFNKQLQVGQWYAFLKIDRDTMCGDKIFYLDGSKQVICPIHFDKKRIHEKTVVLSPYLLPAAFQLNKRVQFDEQDPLRKTYAVKQFVVSHLLPDPQLNQKSTDWFYKQAIHVRGIVIVKRFIDRYQDHSMYDRHAIPVFQTLGIGSGKSNRKLMIQLRQEDTLDMINIYANIDQVHYPLGLVCGATVTFRNLIRKAQKGSNVKFNCNTDGITTIHVESTFAAPKIQSLQIRHIGSKYLASFWDQDGKLQEETEDNVFKLSCQVTSIISLQLKFECKECGSVVRDNECYGLCKFASRLLIASAFIQIDDGTACANATVDGERLVFRLLQLGPNQEESLRRIVSKYGEINYGGWNNSTVVVDNEAQEVSSISMYGLTLEDIYSRAKQAGTIWIYGKLQRQTGKKRQRKFFEDEDTEEIRRYQDGTPIIDIAQRYGLRAFMISDKNNLMRTMELLKFKIKVVEIENVDHSLSAYENLLQLEQSGQDKAKGLEVVNNNGKIL